VRASQSAQNVRRSRSGQARQVRRPNRKRPGRKRRSASRRVRRARPRRAADKCFLTATGEYRSQHPPALVPGARAALDALHDAGVEVVVVSNSVSEKIVGWFRAVGVDAGEAEGHLVRVRGAAGKQVFGDSNACIELAGRRIHVDRPRYRRVIEEERPN
jgi:phosphoserine phosphatase